MKEQPKGEPVPRFREKFISDMHEELPFVTPAPNHVGTHLNYDEFTNSDYRFKIGYIGSIEFYPKGAPQDEL